MPPGPSFSGAVAAIFAPRECVRTLGGLALRMGDGAACVVCWWSAAWSSEEWCMVDTGGKERAGGARASSAPGTAWRWACWRRAARLAQAPSHSMDDASFPIVPRYRGGGGLLPARPLTHQKSSTGKSARCRSRAQARASPGRRKEGDGQRTVLRCLCRSRPDVSARGEAAGCDQGGPFQASTRSALCVRR